MDLRITGLRDFTRELKAVDRDLGKELRQAHLQIARLIEGRAQARMLRGGPQAAEAAKGVKGRATQKQAMLSITNRPPFTLPVVMGQRRRSGWYAARRFRGSTARQFQPWVGNQWDPGETGGKPYFVGPAINESIDEAIDLFGDAIDDLARRAGFK